MPMHSYTAITREFMFTPLTSSDDHPEPLPEDWVAFEKQLGKYKGQYKAMIRQLEMKTQEVQVMNEKRNTLEAVKANLPDEFQTEILDIIQRSQFNTKFADLLDELHRIRSKVKKMRKVLQETNADEYAAFVCPICMESHVNTFLDPCGHVICSQCYIKSGARCPGCRVEVTAKKIFTMN